jgi:hypothetical protein
LATRDAGGFPDEVLPVTPLNLLALPLPIASARITRDPELTKRL